MKAATLLSSLLVVVATFASGGCGGSAPKAQSPLLQSRKDAPGSSDPMMVEGWMAAELLSPLGSPVEVRRARQRLDKLGAKSARAHLLRAIDDHFHGRLKAAPEHYLKAAEAARLQTENREEAELYGWVAVHEALDLRINDPELFRRWKDWVRSAMDDPGGLGWRARGELVDWWTREARRAGETNLDKLSVKQFGCVENARLAGPFGHGSERDALRSFEAEAAGPWPVRWPAEAGVHAEPRVLEIEPRGCFLDAKDPPSIDGNEPSRSGVYYVESYLELPKARDIIVAVQGALAIWIDDSQVLFRDPRKWGIWPSFGVRVRLSPGRHRLLARIASPSTSIRVTRADGSPADVTSSTDPNPGYSLSAPSLGPDPNLLNRYIREGKPLAPPSDLDRLLVAQVAEIEGQSDVASVMIEPLLLDTTKATGLVLLHAARFTEQDPLFETSQVRDLVHALHQKAATRDAGLWEPKLALALWQAEQSGPKDAVLPIVQLSKDYPEVPGILGALAQIYRRLGWSTERSQVIERMSLLYPSDPSSLALAVELDDERGRWDQAEQTARRLQALDPESEIGISRALGREDYKTALVELERLQVRRPDRKEIAERILDVMVRAGNDESAWKKLSVILENDPKNVRARLALADGRLARGQRDALRRAVVDSVQAGAPSDDLKEALDVMEGMTELEPFRLAALPIIDEFEKSGRVLPGTAARILDYAAYWIHADASSRMLEHEVVRIQSAEAIRDFAEYRPPEGLILHLRVIKKDRTVLEPEVVEGKPTVTLPHLDVGDYIETEVVMNFQGDGQHGTSYLGPTWFFREEKLAYDRSELVIVSPRSRPLQLEMRGNAPSPQVEERDGLVVRRWKVVGSPAAATEPLQPSAREVLPNVRVGWGADQALQLRSLVDATAILTPIDPRIVRVARRVVEGAPSAPLEKARRIYHWILDNVEEGPELDGRRVVMGKRGNRWRGFVELCRALEIPVHYGVAHNQLLPAPAGPFEHALQYSEPVLAVGEGKNQTWLALGDKHAPFGYLPPEIRETTAYVLDHEPPTKVAVVATGPTDRFDIQGEGVLEPSGSAKLELTQRFDGKLAIVLRGVLAQAPESQLRSFIEGRLIGQALQGAQLISFKFSNRDDADKPLVLVTRLVVARFAQRHPTGLILSAPFAASLRTLAGPPARETPIVLSESSEQQLRLRLKLPNGARVLALPAARTYTHGKLEVVIRDRMDGETLVLDRATRIPVGRVAVDEYPAFATFARTAGDALLTQIRVELGAQNTN